MSESAEALRLEFGHWGEHPEYPVKDWVYEVTNNHTRLGYWEWVAKLDEVEKEEMGEAAYEDRQFADRYSVNKTRRTATNVTKNDGNH